MYSLSFRCAPFYCLTFDNLIASKTGTSALNQLIPIPQLRQSEEVALLTEQISFQSYYYLSKLPS